jgi:hypothetical protein
MPATYLHFSEELRERKEKLGLCWEEILSIGVEQAEIEHKINLEKAESRAGDREDSKPCKSMAK